MLAAPGGRLVLAREAAAMAPDRPALRGAVWDGRFRLLSEPGPGLAIGALGDEAARLRRGSDLPAAVLRTLPALRRDSRVVAVPHLRYAGGMDFGDVRIAFAPRLPAAAAPFFAVPGMQTTLAHPM